MTTTSGRPTAGEPQPASAERMVLWDEAYVLRRLKRLEGQIRGLQAMVTRRDSCHAILTQVAAAEGALAQVHRLIAACSVVEGLGDVLPIDDPDQVRTRLRQLLDKR